MRACHGVSSPVSVLHMSSQSSCWQSGAMACGRRADATCVNVLGHDPDSRRMKPEKRVTTVCRETTRFLQAQRETTGQMRTRL